MPFWKCHFRNADGKTYDMTLNYTTMQQQQIMTFAYLNSGVITYRLQDIYKNERSFIAALNDLIRQNVFRQKFSEQYYDIYELVKRNGNFYVKNIILK